MAFTFDEFLDPGEGGFKGELLDAVLERGYHRSQHRMYATNLNAYLKEGVGMVVSPVFKIRFELERYRDSGSTRPILNRCAGFETEFLPGVVNGEVEELYARYLQSIDFETAPTCHDYLHEDEWPDPFDTMMVQVRDKGRLIATGYCDRGSASVMGVLSFYDPGYRKYSLGKYLYLRMIHDAVSQNKRYFYPGSIIVGDDKMDYKMFTGRESIATYLPLEEEWRDHSEWDKARMREYFSALFRPSDD
jgi:arginine-tRNA-protein transferase